MKKLLSFIFLLASITTASAFTPPKQINVTVGFAPGSGNEVSFRGIAAIIEKNNPNINFVITNRPGADEVIAMNFFAQQPKDGSHLYIPSQQGAFTIIEQWYPDQLKVNPMDLELITTIAKSPLAIVANVNSKTNTPRELLDRVRNTNENINFAIGASAHRLLFEYMMDHGKGNSNRVQSVLYRGPAQAVQDVAGGQAEFGIMPVAVSYPLYKAGKIKYIGLASDYKISAIPEVPLLKEAIPGLTIYGAWMIALPPETPKEIVKYYQDLFVTAIRSPEAKQFFEQNLMIAIPEEQSPEGAKKFINHIRTVWMPYAKKIKPN